MTRRARWTIGASLASLPFMLPHVVEDFAGGIAERVGLSTAAGAFLLGAFLAAQMAGLVLVGRDRRAGWVVTFGAGLVWVAGAVIDHGPPIVAGAFREGLTSVVWVLGLIAGQATAATLAWRGWRRARQ